MTTKRHFKKLPIMLVLGSTSMMCEGVWINEIHYDNVGGDTGEFVEIAGAAGTNLTGWRILLYNGANGAVYDTIPLGGTFGDSAAGFGFLAFSRAPIQNGSPDGLALVNDANQVLQFLSYEGQFTAIGGLADGLVSVDIGVDESESTPVGFSLQLSGTGTSYSNFIWQSPQIATPGVANRNQSFVTAAETVQNSGSSLGMLAMVVGLIPFAARFSRR